MGLTFDSRSPAVCFQTARRTRNKSAMWACGMRPHLYQTIGQLQKRHQAALDKSKFLASSFHLLPHSLWSPLRAGLRLQKYSEGRPEQSPFQSFYQEPASTPEFRFDMGFGRHCLRKSLPAPSRSPRLTQSSVSSQNVRAWYDEEFHPQSGSTPPPCAQQNTEEGLSRLYIAPSYLFSIHQTCIFSCLCFTLFKDSPSLPPISAYLTHASLRDQHGVAQWSS